MRLLKQKVQRALQLAQHRQAQEAKICSQNLLKILTARKESPENKVQNVKGVLRKKRKLSPGNNIMKNYCRALVNFGLSSLAVPYLSNQEENSLSYERFFQILTLRKKSTNCIKGLRGLLLKERRDSRETRAFKGMFQGACGVSPKYFCVNWIFNSKVDDKVKHLRYRGRILRRVQNPQYFTYLEDIKTIRNNT